MTKGKTKKTTQYVDVSGIISLLYPVKILLHGRTTAKYNIIPTRSIILLWSTFHLVIRLVNII